ERQLARDAQLDLMSLEPVSIQEWRRAKILEDVAVFEPHDEIAQLIVGEGEPRQRPLIETRLRRGRRLLADPAGEAKAPRRLPLDMSAPELRHVRARQPDVVEDAGVGGDRPPARDPHRRRGVPRALPQPRERVVAPAIDHRVLPAAPDAEPPWMQVERRAVAHDAGVA